MIPKYRKLTQEERERYNELFPDKGYKYILLEDIYYVSRKYRKAVAIPMGRLSDGATGAIDIPSLGWWIHDELCWSGKWADGTPCNNWQASTVLAIILADEKRYLRSVYWWGMTWLVGGDKARDNGMWAWSKKN